jgi:predicted RNA-binding Zn ribbon-like protein
MAVDAAGQFVFEFTGGRVCLDFANTMDGSRARPTERLTSYAALVRWAQQAGLLSDAEARDLRRSAERAPAAAARVLADAIALREALYRIFSSVIDGTPLPKRDLALLNERLAAALGRLEIEPGGRAGREMPPPFAWRWRAEAGDLDRMLWPVLRSAGELLASSEMAHVRRCAGENCDWLFLDTSRSHRRRWCEMQGCGNRAKARRYYARKRLREED